MVGNSSRERAGVRRQLRAFLIAPLTVPLLYWLGGLAAAAADPARRLDLQNNPLRGMVVVFAFAAPVAYAATLVLALPLLWLLRRLGSLTLARTVLVGSVIGCGVALVLEPRLRGDLFSVPLPPWEGALLGGAAAAVWWLLEQSPAT